MNRAASKTRSRRPYQTVVSSSRSILLYSMPACAFAGFLVLFTVVLISQPRSAPQAEPKATPVVLMPTKAEPEKTQPAPAKPQVVVESKQQRDPELPSEVVRPLGRFVTANPTFPGILLQRRGINHPWVPLAHEEEISSTHVLMSLPGYDSLVELKAGVHVSLWGSVPEFAQSSTALESRVSFFVPPSGFDADMLLERGRVRITNRRTSGPAQVRLRFVRETWDLVLPQGAEVVAELGTLPTAEGTRVQHNLALHARAAFKVRVAGSNIDMMEKARLTWPGNYRPEIPSEMPEWWERPFDRSRPEVDDMLLALADWAKLLRQSKDVVDTVRSQVIENDYPAHRIAGVLFLGSLDAAPLLVGLLDRERALPALRGAAVYALQTWLSRSPAHAAELARSLGNSGYSREKSALIARLLQPLSTADRGRGDGLHQLIAHLEHEDLIIRDLALRQLFLLAPKEVEAVGLEPTATPERRREKLAQIKSLLDSGKLAAAN